MPWETDVDGGQALAEFAGRACYQSWDKPNPATATNRGYLRHILEVGHLSVLEHGTVTHVPHRGVPVGGARAGAAPALLLQPALPAIRARAGRRVVEPAVIAEDPELHDRFLAATDAALAAYAELLDGLEQRFADVPNAVAAPQAGPPGGPRGAAELRSRRASWSPATTARGGTSWRCGPASTPTSRSASWRSPACGSCRRVAGNVFDDFRISALADGTEVAASPYATEG